MKLRNKKTREIGKIAKTKTNDEEIEIITDTRVYLYKSISEVCADWEDVGIFWFLSGCGDVYKNEEDDNSEETLEKTKQIGNYFKTKEDAEKAAEKLKAWKRLRDKGFEFCNYSALAYGEIDFRIPDFEGWDDKETEQTRADLDLLFGDEE